MKTIKQVLRPERVRGTPEQFSWVDHALVQHHLIDRCSSHSAALYLFLITVADCEGLSYYASATLASRLHLSEAELAAARSQLMALDLIDCLAGAALPSAGLAQQTRPRFSGSLHAASGHTRVTTAPTNTHTKRTSSYSPFKSGPTP